MAVACHLLEFERVYPASPTRVFLAISDPRAREQWSVPAGSRLVYEQACFEIGGVDVSRCGAPDDLRYRVENRYLDIVPDERIVLSETTTEAGRTLSHSLNVTELFREGEGCRLRLTVMMAAIEPGMVEGARHGYGAALDNLLGELNASMKELADPR